MKLKALAALCKRSNSYHLYDCVNRDGEITGQWLGTGGAIYPLSSVPLLTEDNLVALFDITEKQRANAYFYCEPLPTFLNFDDDAPGERQIDREEFTLCRNGREVRPAFTQSGIEFIDTAFFAPLADVADDLELFERRTPSGGAYFAAKLGLLIVGVIMPMNIIDGEFVGHLEAVAQNCRAALSLKQAKDAEAGDASGDATQQTL